MSNVTTLPAAEETRAITMNLMPKNLDEALRFADVLAKSSVIPKDYIGQPGNILVAMQWGAELGLAPLQAMQSIAVINGRPSIWGDAMLALVRGSGRMEYIREEIGDMQATCRLKRVGEDELVRTFSMEDAKRAGLAGKSGPWAQYPKRMMQMRARAFALRDAFPDVLRGVHIAEEARDIPRDMGMAEVVDAAPKKGTAGFKARIAKPTAGPTVDAVIGAIDRAVSPDDLRAAAELAAQLASDADRATAASTYKARLAHLKQVELAARRESETKKDAAASTIDPDTGEIVEEASKTATTAAPTVSYAVIADALNRAKNADERDAAASLIADVPDIDQQAELVALYQQLQKA